ncbi:hypothetical protein NT6N_08450 [Oceaniferula spumae]|uniref:Uncharacterized protein n=1 Tax=Oceaniferula spumae TaxID=2979115 RepID=A0AAT9FIP4_9BACT
MSEIPHLYFLALACSSLFLFGSIKLKKLQETAGRRLLVIGFSIITLSSIFNIAAALEIIEIKYNPYMIAFEHMSSLPRWHKWVFWGQYLIIILGGILGIVGFILEARLQTSLQRRMHYQSQS